MESIGRYEILDELGRGAMGVVYKARDTRIGREVAIKTIRLTDKVDPSEVTALRERLFREAQSAGRLSHPGIVTIYDIEEEDDIAYISMEFVEGDTIEHMITTGDAGDLAFVAKAMRLAAAALDYAHSRDIIHRDVKPANLMVNTEGRIKITDFGIARISSSQLTQTGTVMGTPSYMSPEQVKGDPLDGRSDQFSLAVIAYEMLTGQKPFAGENLTSVMFKIVSESPVDPKDLNPRIVAPVQEALLKALSKNPADRYPACAAFAAALASQLEAAQTIQGAATTTTGRRDKDDTAGSVDMTAPAIPAMRVEEAEAETGKPAPAAALPPLSSRPAKSTPEVAAGKLPHPARRAPRDDERSTARRLWPLAAAVAVLVVVAGLLALYPWVLDDPIGLLRAMFGGQPIDQQMESSVDLLIDKDRRPIPPVELTEPLEETVSEQQADAPAEASSGESSAAASAAPGGESTAETPLPAETETSTEEPAVTAQTKEPPAQKTTPPPPPQPRTAAVNLKATADGAQVVVDRNPRWSCVAPCTLELPRGRHVAVASLAGYRSYPKIFEAGSEPSDVEIQMRRITGTLLISSEPTGAEVLIDGRRIEGATNMQHDVPPGYHVVSVRKQDAGTAERSLKVSEGGLHPIHFILRSQGIERSRLTVRSEPAGADIVVNDNKRIGATPTEVDLAPGRYRVAVSRSGYRPVIQEVELTAGKPESLNVTLSPQN